MIRAALATMLALMTAGCFTISRGPTQDVRVSVNVPATVRLNGAEGRATPEQDGDAVLKVPRSREIPCMLSVTPHDGRPAFTVEIAPHKGASFAWHDYFLIVCDLPLILPIIVDACAGYGWGWPEQIAVYFPDTGAPSLSNVVRR